MTGLMQKAERAEKYFELWWSLNGQHFEEKWGYKHGLTKKEISSHAFVAGYIAGFNQGRKEQPNDQEA